MFRMHTISRFTTALLVTATVACRDDRTPVAPAPESPSVLRIVQATGAPSGAPVNGRIVFTRPAGPNDLDVYSVNPDGTDRRQLTSGAAMDMSPTVSPDGRRIAFTRLELGGTPEIYVMNADGSRLRKLTAFGPAGYALDPAWSPDGKRIAFAGSPDGGNGDIYVMSANGRNPIPLTDLGPTDAFDDKEPAWSRDGQRIAFTRGAVSRNVMVMNADGSGLEAFTNCNTGHCTAPSWSPDGARIAYENASTVGTTLDVKSFGQPAQPIATDIRRAHGGPAWAPDGTKLVYPGLVAVEGSQQAALVTIAPDGSGAKPVSATPGATYPVWGR